MSDSLRLGIDAGGTYTDVALVGRESGKVVVWAKSLTTRPDPSAGISAALDQINPSLLKKVRLVSLSTTFATNAIVEGMGAEAGLILIGYDECPPGLPSDTHVLRIEGGHHVNGDEKIGLAETALRSRIESFLDGLA
ncbi:unnamed protein product, partial [marine sediment metagenome]